MNFGSTEQPVINKNFFDYYSVISDDWSFKDYPKFEPHKVGGVTVGDSPLDFKRTAKGVQDYNMWEQGGTDNTLKPDDFDKYKEQKSLMKISVLLISDLTALNQCLTARPIFSSS